jgi:DNA-binding transcriptional MocR family regulator
VVGKGVVSAVAARSRHGTLIIEDDYDAEFRYDRVPIGTLQGLAPDHVTRVKRSTCSTAS